MRKKQEKLFIKTKLFIIVALIVFIFSVVKVGLSIASSDNFVITNAEITDKSSDVLVNEFDFDDSKILSDIVFFKVGDSITYTLQIKNNSQKNYTVKSISDDNENEYIKLVYTDVTGTKIDSKQEFIFEITQKYENENIDIQKRNQSFSAKIKFVFEDEDGEIIDEDIPIDTSTEVNEDTPIAPIGPKTGDNVNLYIAMAGISLLTMIVLITKKSGVKTGKHRGRSGKAKFLSIILIGIIALPTMSKAATTEYFEITINSNIMLKNIVVVTCDVAGTNYDIVVEYGGKVENLPNTQREGYNFKGWKKEDGTDFNENENIIEDTKIIAKYEAIEYEITYDLQGGSAEGEITTKYTVESDNIVLKNPTRTDYSFEGWTGTGLNEMTKNVTIPKGSTGNRSYVAHWKKEVFDIQFDPNGGTVETTSMRVNSGNQIGTLPVPEREEYVFMGWYEDLDSNTKITAETVPTGDTTYHAKWIERMSTVFSLQGPIIFNHGDNISGENVPDEYKTQAYINTGIEVFNERNYGRDFEIGFEIVTYNTHAAANSLYEQSTIVNAKLEDAAKNYPGFAFRGYDRVAGYLELTSRSGSAKIDGRSGYNWEAQVIHKVVLYRIGNTLYYSIDEGNKVACHSYDAITYRFGTPVTFGASLQNDGTPFRYLDGTIKDVYIKLENKAEDFE